jgi:hypothetical protein
VSSGGARFTRASPVDVVVRRGAARRGSAGSNEHLMFGETQMRDVAEMPRSLVDQASKSLFADVLEHLESSRFGLE